MLLLNGAIAPAAESIIGYSSAKRKWKPSPASFPERVEILCRNIKTRMALLKAATILKEKNPAPPFPQTLDSRDLPHDPWMPEVFVDNPLAPPTKLLYRCGEGYVYIYSVGPDQKDELARISYDPERDSKSAGDIILIVR